MKASRKLTKPWIIGYTMWSKYLYSRDERHPYARFQDIRLYLDQEFFCQSTQSRNIMKLRIVQCFCGCLESLQNKGVLVINQPRGRLGEIQLRFGHQSSLGPIQWKYGGIWEEYWSRCTFSFLANYWLVLSSHEFLGPIFCRNVVMQWSNFSNLVN